MIFPGNSHGKGEMNFVDRFYIILYNFAYESVKYCSTCRHGLRAILIFAYTLHYYSLRDVRYCSSVIDFLNCQDSKVYYLLYTCRITKIFKFETKNYETLKMYTKDSLIFLFNVKMCRKNIYASLPYENIFNIVTHYFKKYQ